jgi:hypothetical protein
LIKAVGHGLSYPINTIEASSLSPGYKILLNKKEWLYFPIERLAHYSGSIVVEHKTYQMIHFEIKKYF